MFEKLVNIVANKKPNGRIEVEQISLKDAVFDDEDTLFDKAVLKVATKDLAKQIHIMILGIAYGEERVKLALECADKYGGKYRDEKGFEFAKANNIMRLVNYENYFELTRDSYPLAHAIAEQLINSKFKT